jgi:hypothetical protein
MPEFNELAPVAQDVEIPNDIATETPVVETAETAQVTDESGKPVEVTPELTKEKKAEIKASRYFAEISKREGELRRKEKSIKESSIKAEQYEKDKEFAKKNPIKYLQKLTGLSFDEVINLSLNDLDSKPEDPNKKIEEKLALWEKEREQEKVTKFKQQNDLAWNQHISKVAEFVNKNSDNYEVILSHPDRGTEIYKELVNDTIRLAGRELTGDEVVALIDRTEQLLTHEVKPLFERLSKSKKFSSKTGDNKPVPEKTISDNRPKTLTNSIESSGSTAVKGKVLSHEDAIEAIRKQFG